MTKCARIKGKVWGGVIYEEFDAERLKADLLHQDSAEK